MKEVKIPFKGQSKIEAWKYMQISTLFFTCIEEDERLSKLPQWVIVSIIDSCVNIIISTSFSSYNVIALSQEKSWEGKTSWGAEKERKRKREWWESQSC